MLSKATMIQSVLQAIHLHLMSCLKIPKTICVAIEQQFRVFFYWKDTQNANKTHWINWEILCNRKFDGGLGTRNISLFNQALFGKQCWNLIISSKTLMAHLFQELYHPNIPPLGGCYSQQNIPLLEGYFMGKRTLEGRDMMDPNKH